jgi:D-glycero-beta-D-manno-heptose 1-phosphate adenylyltransferase
MDTLDTRRKVLDPQTLPAWRAQIRAAGKTLVVTNGCFDLLHAGHVAYLEAARNQGDLLLVGLNTDDSVRQLKGANRPVNPQDDRARVLAALQAVDAVCFFPETRATRFLREAQPDVYVKGGDLQVDDLPAEERAAVTQIGGRILTLAGLPGRSSTGLLHRIQT